MLRSLPVSDPSRLYRIGDGDSCCVQGGPQDRWGMFSFPLFERLKAELPEFEEIAAFQAAGPRLSVRRQGTESTSRPLRSEYVTGNYFSTLGVNAFGGRVFTAADDTPAAAPVVVLSHHVWQGTYGGGSIARRRHARHRGPPVHGRRGDGARVFRRDAPRRSSGSVDSAAAGAPHQRRHLDTPPARVGVAARDWPAPPRCDDRRSWPTTHRDPPPVDAARLGLPAELDARYHPGFATAGDRGSACGRRCRRHEGAVRPQPADSSRRVRTGAAAGVRQRRQPAARARGRTARPNGVAAGDRRVAPPDRHAGARREHPSRRRRRHRRARRRHRHGATARWRWHSPG